MTSREALEELRSLLSSNPGTRKYCDIFEEHLLKPIENDLDRLEKMDLKTAQGDKYL